MKSKYRNYLGLISLLAYITFSTFSNAGATLDRIKEESVLQCAFTQQSQGLAAQNEKGEWNGFFIDFCKAFAIAVTGSPQAVEWNLIDTVHRFEALGSGEVDVLVANTTWTHRRDTTLGLKFTGIYFYDGQGFMVHTDNPATNLAELQKGIVCVGEGTTTLLNLEEIIATSNPALTIKSFNTIAARVNAFFARKCDVMTDDTMALASYQDMSPTDTNQLRILPDVISKEPLGPVVRDDDTEWFDVVRWTLFATIAAEELGITSQNIDAMLKSKNPHIRRFLGVEGEIGISMGIPNDWAYQVIKQIGNYEEIYNRNIGPGTGTNLKRNLNALWIDGGLLYAPPFR